MHKIKAALKSDENEIASQYLRSLRKEFDKMSKNIRMQASGINVMRKEIDFMREKVRNQTGYHVNSQDRVESLQKEL